jgi:membrane-associated protease RseP (regulator of RpoE activity)
LEEERDGLEEISRLVGDVFRVDTAEIRTGGIRLKGNLLVRPDAAIGVLRERLKDRGLTPMLSRRGGETALVLARLRPEVSGGRSSINLLLFVVTVFTTLLAGSLWESKNLVDAFMNLNRGIPFSFSLLCILGAHELGHFFTAKKLGIDATLPYFIPGPYFIGTFGAVIRIKSPIPNRRALVMMGAAGPLCGMAVALPISIVGLKLSKVASMQEIQGGLMIGSSVVFAVLEKTMFRGMGETQGILLHPMAFAGWLGMFVTGLNLLPIGQLDGGHIAYSILGRSHRQVGLVFLALLVATGIVFRFLGYALFGILILLVGFKHPPPLDDVTPLSYSHRLVAGVTMLVLILTFVPQPFILR